MRRFCRGGAVAALLLATAGTLAAADAPAPWYQRWFGLGGSAAPADQPAPARKTTVRMSGDPVSPERELAERLRRMAVCDRMRQIAIEKQDEKLLAEADRLEAEARDIYEQRMAALPAVKSPAPKAGKSRKEAKP